MTPESAEILVVGGGPAGAAAAGELARRGRDVLVVEAAPGPRDRVCGEFVSGEALPVLARLGALAAVRRARPARLGQTRFTAAGRGLDVDLPSPRGGTCAGLGIRRRVLDELLLQAAGVRGARIARATRVRGLLRDGDGVLRGVEVQSRGGVGTIACRVVVGADGRGSAVARLAGLDRGATGPAHCALKVHVRPGRGARGLGDTVEVHLFPGGYVGVQPVDDGRLSVSAVVHADLARRLGGGALSVLMGAAGTSPAARARLAGAVPLSHPVALYPLERRRSGTVADGVVLVGDAAGVVPPFAGDGIAVALRSGILAAAHLDAALARGDVSARGLSRYASARRRHLARPLLVSRALDRLVHRPALAGPVLSLLDRVRPLPRLLVRSTRIP